MFATLVSGRTLAFSVTAVRLVTPATAHARHVQPVIALATYASFASTATLCVTMQYICRERVECQDV